MLRVGATTALHRSATPRVHTEGNLALTLAAAWPEAVADHFKKVGYDVKTGPGAANVAIERDPAASPAVRISTRSPPEALEPFLLGHAEGELLAQRVVRDARVLAQ